MARIQINKLLLRIAVEIQLMHRGYSFAICHYTLALKKNSDTNIVLDASPTKTNIKICFPIIGHYYLVTFVWKRH